MNKITEKQIVTAVSADASVLITQKDENGVEVLRRAGVDDLLETSQVKEDVDELKNNIPPQIDNIEKNDAALWDLSEGVVYDKKEQVEAGMADVPDDAAYMWLVDVRGKSEQDGDPTPDNPQEIHSVEELNVKVVGKNLLTFARLSAPMTDHGITFTQVWNGDELVRIDVNGTATDTARYNMNVSSVPAAPAGTYVLTGCPSGGSNSTFTQYLFSDGFTDSANDVGNGVTVQFANKIGTYRIVVFGGVTVNTSFYPMIRYASEKNDTYVPYTEQTRAITPPRPLNKVGNYVDVCDIGTGMWKYANKMETWTNTTSFSLWTASSGSLQKTITGMKTMTGPAYESEIDCIISSSLQALPRKTVAEKKKTGICIINGTSRQIGIYAGEGLNTVEAFKNYLAEHPMNVVYQADEVENISINADDLAYLRSLSAITAEHHITITDQDGNDVSYLMRYLSRAKNMRQEVAEIKATTTELKSDYAQQIELLKAVRDALKGGDIDGAVGLLDTYLLDKEVLA